MFSAFLNEVCGALPHHNIINSGKQRERWRKPVWTSVILGYTLIKSFRRIYDHTEIYRISSFLQTLDGEWPAHDLWPHQNALAETSSITFHTSFAELVLREKSLNRVTAPRDYSILTASGAQSITQQKIQGENPTKNSATTLRAFPLIFH